MFNNYTNNNKQYNKPTLAEFRYFCRNYNYMDMHDLVNFIIKIRTEKIDSLQRYYNYYYKRNYATLKKIEELNKDTINILRYKYNQGLYNDTPEFKCIRKFQDFMCMKSDIERFENHLKSTGISGELDFDDKIQEIMNDCENLYNKYVKQNYHNHNSNYNAEQNLKNQIINWYNKNNLSTRLYDMYLNRSILDKESRITFEKLCNIAQGHIEELNYFGFNKRDDSQYNFNAITSFINFRLDNIEREMNNRNNNLNIGNIMNQNLFNNYPHRYPNNNYNPNYLNNNPNNSYLNNYNFH